MNAIDLPELIQQVLWGTFILTFIFGFVLQRTHFCTMGAVSDIINIGDWTRMRMWMLAIGVAVIGTNLLAAAGLIDTAQTIYTTPKLAWLSTLIGGLIFGIGMVLTSGCGSKTLVRIGGGNLKALFVFVVLGVSSYMTMRGLFAWVRVNGVDLIAVTLPTTQDLPTLLASAMEMDRARAQTWLGLSIGGVFVSFALLRRELWTFDGLLGGIVPGLVIVGIWYLSGHVGFIAEHPETLQETFLATNSGRMESLSFVAPYGYTLDWLMMWSDNSKTLTIGIVSVFGVIGGAFAYSLWSRSFRWEGFAGVEDTANHFIGAILMGVGGVTALGCTIGQGLSGLSTLALGAIIALASIIAGAVLGIRYQTWRLERSM